MEKFRFRKICPLRRYVMTVHMPYTMYERIKKAGENIGIRHGKGSGRVKKGLSEQELVRQMIDHCLKDMGY